MGDDAADTPEVRQIPPRTAGRVASASPVSAWARWLSRSATGLFAGGVDLLFPPRCPLCRREPDAAPAEPPDADGPEAGAPAWGAPVCDRCVRELVADPARCPACGTLAASMEHCPACRRSRPPWRRIVVLSSYDGGLREAVLRAKRPSGEDVAAALATLLVRKHLTTLEACRIDRVVPVPMHWLRRGLRGSSAADAIAARLAVSLCRPWSRSLVRRRATRMQNSLPAADRAANVQEAFVCREAVAGARILLVDDVLTTGATASACCRTLRAAGAASVDVAVVARADGGSPEADRGGGFTS